MMIVITKLYSTPTHFISKTVKIYIYFTYVQDRVYNVTTTLDIRYGFQSAAI